MGNCGATHDMIWLSLFSGIFTAVMFVITLPLTFSIVYVLLRNKERKFNGLFYKLLLNIAVADFLTGAVADPAAMNWDFREAYKVTSMLDLYALHVSMFMTDAVALVTMTMLSVDRLVALLKPYLYRDGLTHASENLLVLLAWPLGLLIVVPYFQLGYIKELALFTAANVLLASVSLVVTALVYRVKFQDFSPVTTASVRSTAAYSSSVSCESSKSEVSQEWPKERHMSSVHLMHMDSAEGAHVNVEYVEYEEIPGNTEDAKIDSEIVSDTGTVNSSSDPRPSITTVHFATLDLPTQHTASNQCAPTVNGSVEVDQIQVSEKNAKRKSKPRTYVQKRVTRTFMLMLLVFILSYFPTCIMMIYMNVCQTCDCQVVHVMRDLSIIAILSSSPLRALNFIFTLKHLNKSVRDLFCWWKSADSEDDT